MKRGRIVLITGSPGTGKTTVAAVLAQKSEWEKSVHMHTDDFYRYLSKGALPPHHPGAEEQNLIAIEAFLEGAKRFADGGYDVIVDGVVDPWFLEPWRKAAEAGYEVHYIVLRADREETMKRATAREKLDRETNRELVRVMWEQFCDLGPYEGNVVDSTNLCIEETVAAVKERLEKKAALLSEG